MEGQVLCTVVVTRLCLNPVSGFRMGGCVKMSCELVTSYFQETVGQAVVGLLINDVWYGRPWDEYWIFRFCEFDPVTDGFTLDFEYNHAVSVQGAEFHLDEQGFLVINFQSAVITNYRNQQKLQNGVLRFVYQRDDIEIWHKT